MQSKDNLQAVHKLVQSGLIVQEYDLRLVLANLAVQLYYQSHGLENRGCNVLQDFLREGLQDRFYPFILDLLGGRLSEDSELGRLKPVLEAGIRFVRGEDILGCVYLSLQDLGGRKQSGAYYTPASIVSQLLDSLQEQDANLTARIFCDPCCGSGNFLLQLACRGVPGEHLFGQELDPVSACLCRINLALLFPQLTYAQLQEQILTGNTLFDTFEQQFEVIAGNPPWGSNLSAKDISRCRRRFATAAVAGARPETCDLFVEKALSMLSPGGMLAFVLPEAVLTVNSHKAARKLLLEQGSFSFVTYAGNIFDKVMCPAVLLGIRRDGRGSAVGCKVSMKQGSFTISQDRELSADSLLLHLDDAEYACLQAIEHCSPVTYLKGQARFGLGIVTGDNSRYLSAKPAAGYEPVLRGSDICRYATGKAGSYIRFEPEALQQVAPEDIYRAPEKLLYRFVCEQPVFAYDDRQTLSLNSCNIVIPQLPGLSVKYVLAVLNSSVCAFYLSRRFRSVKVLRSHLEQVPIPVPTQQEHDAVVVAADKMLQLCRAGDMPLEQILRQYLLLDDLIVQLFDLPAEHRETIRQALQGKNLFLPKN